MTMMTGRVRKVTKAGHIFLDPQDGGVDVFASNKILLGETFNVGDIAGA